MKARFWQRPRHAICPEVPSLEYHRRSGQRLVPARRRSILHSFASIVRQWDMDGAWSCQFIRFVATYLHGTPRSTAWLSYRELFRHEKVRERVFLCTFYFRLSAAVVQRKEDHRKEPTEGAPIAVARPWAPFVKGLGGRATTVAPVTPR